MLHPAAIAQYRADVEQLAALIATAKHRPDELIDVVRRIIKAVIVRPGPRGRGFELEIQGRLN